jgi:SulP family sulfate permease
MNLNIPFRPRLFDTLKWYTAKDFVPDLIAGVTVGIVALPLAMAFAIASGVKPEAGIFIAVVAGFIISALGGTKVSIGAPTGACTPVAGIIHAVTLLGSSEGPSARNPGKIPVQLN